MLFKIIGIFIIVVSTSLGGWYLSNTLKKRIEEIQEMQTILNMLENEIIFLSSTLSEAFTSLSRNCKSNIKNILTCMTQNLKLSSMDAKNAWTNSINDSQSKLSLNLEDLDIIEKFGDMLGKSDNEGQILNIRHTIEKLKYQETIAKQIFEKNGTFYRKFSVLIGLAIGLITF